MLLLLDFHDPVTTSYPQSLSFPFNYKECILDM